MTEREQELENEVLQLREEVRLLKQKLDHVIRQLFGAKSEKLDPDQLELLLQGLDPGKEPASPDNAPVEAVTKTKRKGSAPRRPRIPEDLPAVEEVLIPEFVQACPEAWRRIGEEVSEQLDYRPGRFLRRVTIRPKYVKHSEPETPPVIADLPERLVERGSLAPGLLAHIVISKYADHLPLYRQQQIYAQRHKVHLPRQTLARAVEQVADWLAPVVREMSERQFAGDYVQIDETPVKFLEPGRGKTAQGYFWTVHVPGADTVYHWHPSRSHSCLLKIVPERFAGTLQCDAYAAYGTFAAQRPDVELAGCWTHTRRKFTDALDQREAVTRCGWVLRQIGHLYRIEEDLRRSRAGPKLRDAIRQSQSLVIAHRIYQALQRFKLSREHLPQSLLGKAIDYGLRQWPMLERSVMLAGVQLDTNLVENAIRPTAVGKKNWMFIGAKEAGWRSAVLYSIITSCRTYGVDPHAYLEDVLQRLPGMTNHQIPGITPKAWAADQRQPMTLAS